MSDEHSGPRQSPTPRPPVTGAKAGLNYLLFCVGGAIIFGIGGVASLSVQNSSGGKAAGLTVVFVVFGVLFGGWLAHQRNRGKSGF